MNRSVLLLCLGAFALSAACSRQEATAPVTEPADDYATPDATEPGTTAPPAYEEPNTMPPDTTTEPNQMPPETTPQDDTATAPDTTGTAEDPSTPQQ